ncbi:hypothetical protein PVW46_16750 [Mameliella sp. AT18]|nr:hypothetical protein [Mameliella sp. AT18]MDD9731554.1 hypothetical protein [Mameliella sp. AT18]
MRRTDKASERWIVVFGQPDRTERQDILGISQRTQDEVRQLHRRPAGGYRRKTLPEADQVHQSLETRASRLDLGKHRMVGKPPHDIVMDLRSRRDAARDELLFAQIRPVEFALIGKSVPFAKGYVNPFTPQLRALAIPDRTRARHEHYVEFARPQRCDVIIATAVANVDPNLRILLAISDKQFPEEPASERGQNTDPDRPRFGPAGGASRAPRLVELLKGGLHVIKETLPGIGEPNPRVAPFEQRNAKLVFQPHDLAADTGLPDPERFCRLSQASVFSGGYEVADF